MKPEQSTLGKIGATKTVLVFESGGDPKAVITDLTVRVVERSEKDVLTFTGPVEFETPTQTHVNEVVLPLVDRIAYLLNIPRRDFTISASNLQVAANLDVGVRVSGYSADLPLFVAMISALTGVPVPQDLLMTGHIASSEGHIRIVRNMPAKLLAAAEEKSVRRVIYPDPDTDISMMVLAPDERESILTALAQAKASVILSSVPDIAHALRESFSDEAVIQAAIIRGVDEAERDNAGPEDIVRLAARHLGQNLSKRFFCVLDTMLRAGRVSDARAVVCGWIASHLDSRHYPQGFGRSLAEIIPTVPPLARRQFTSPPLLSEEVLGRFTELAGKEDGADLHALYDIDKCRNSGHSQRDSNAAVNVSHVLEQISPEHLCREVTQPIDEARASFSLQSVTVSNNGEFLDTLSAFYVHLLQRTCSMERPSQWKEIEPEVNALIESAFARDGGRAAALSEAKTGVNGGMRSVVDRLTEQYRQRRQNEYVEAVIASAIDPFDWESKVTFVRELLDRCSDIRPPEMDDKPIECFADRYAQLAKAYVAATSHVRRMMRSI